MVKRTRRRLICLVLIGLGLFISGYLLSRYFDLHENPSVQGTGFCSVVLKMDCDSSLLSDKAKQFGIPVAGWGIVYFTTLAILLILGHVLKSNFDPEAALGALLLSTAGAGVSIYLVVIILAGHALFCPLCVAIHVLNISLVVMIWRFNDRSFSQIKRSLIDLVRYLLGRPIENGLQMKLTSMGFLVVALSAVAIYQYIVFQTERLSPEPTTDARQVLIDYSFMPVEKIPIDELDPRMGDGPIQVVIFSSFQCPACRVVSKYLHQFYNRYKDKIQIIYKHYPLGKVCNSRLDEEKYPNACEAAWVAEAAKIENSFWPIHDSLQALDFNDPDDPIGQLTQKMGLASTAFDELCKSEIVRKKVQKDIALGNRLGVTGTPTIYINGRKVLHFELWALDLLFTAIIDYPQLDLEKAAAADSLSKAASK